MAQHDVGWPKPYLQLTCICVFQSSGSIKKKQSLCMRNLVKVNSCSRKRRGCTSPVHSVGLQVMAIRIQKQIRDTVVVGARYDKGTSTEK